MKYFETIILGGGASGTMCALICNEKNVAIIDNANRLAKKLLVTGNGKCNLSNINIDNHATTDYYNVNLKKYIDKFNVKQTLSFFRSLGLETYFDNEGRVYPITSSASSVQDVIVNEINKKNVNVFLQNNIIKIKKDNELFIIQTDKEVFSCKKLVFCLGGNQNELLSSFGLNIKKSVPSLCALKTQKTNHLSGKRLENVKVSATCYKSGETKSEMGDVLFKDDGLSGIVIFNLSSCFSRYNSFEGKIEIDLLPHISEQELYEMLLQRRQLSVKVSDFFVGLLINQIAYTIFNQCKTDEGRLSDKLTDKEIEEFVKIIKNMKFEVKGYYDNNQIYCGGVPLNELDENLQSKKIPNLFICGEACDVDGVCGGFNLQWAWTSGYIVGKNL